MSTVFSEELQFVTDLSSLLNGTKVKLTKGIVTGAGSGTFKKMEILITEPSIDSQHIERQMNYLKSIPALALINSKVTNLSDYRYVDVVIDSKSLGKSSVRYESSELKQVRECIPTINGYIFGIQHLNKDSLQYYSDPEKLRRKPIDYLLTALAKTDSVYGKAHDPNFQGFRVGDYNGRRSFYFFVALPRKEKNHIIDIVVDPTIRKVMAVNL
ncbi:MULTISPECIES: hypothetical protein [Niastella]|uniref:Uncharacterized protein n=1 Tax=Niastella soli TaxID=2821487 RepID=A0ABS3YWA2_9BACT|nr:hypothetical protein [Niastella soli]MBO9202018.1 hypothetical protein [Niastella soli]